VPCTIIIAWLHAVMVIATVGVVSVSTVRWIIDLSIRWSLIAVSEDQRSGDRRGVIRRVASAPAPGLNAQVTVLERIGYV
jgi:hypothetical protein